MRGFFELYIEGGSWDLVICICFSPSFSCLCVSFVSSSLPLTLVSHVVSVPESSLFPSLTPIALLPKLLASPRLQIETQMEFPVAFSDRRFRLHVPRPSPFSLPPCPALSQSPVSLAPPTPAVSGFEVCLQESSRENLFLLCLV